MTDRDLVLVDLRGTGASQPALACPALLLVGALDPVHPRESSDAIARHLTAAQVIELPGLGHGTVDAHACPRALMRAFLADPAAPLDTSCVAGMPGPSGVSSAAAD